MNNSLFHYISLSFISEIVHKGNKNQTDFYYNCVILEIDKGIVKFSHTEMTVYLEKSKESHKFEVDETSWVFQYISDCEFIKLVYN